MLVKSTFPENLVKTCKAHVFLNPAQLEGLPVNLLRSRNYLPRRIQLISSRKIGIHTWFLFLEDNKNMTVCYTLHLPRFKLEKGVEIDIMVSDNSEPCSHNDKVKRNF